ncbi:MAG: cytochrome o ubiquinol oxidase subunit IV [Pseudomonadota bacterium]
MSDHAAGAGHTSPHGDGSGHGDHEAHGSYRSYMIGFVLSVVLTLIPFLLVLGEFEVNLILAIAVIFIAGAVQMAVHIFYFLHVTVQAESGWQAMSLVFTVLLVVICLAGSIWVMFHLNENMMPDHELIDRVRNLP